VSSSATIVLTVIRALLPSSVLRAKERSIR
jgi:hypothetical protein